MKFLVKHPGSHNLVFMSKRYEGFTPDPVFSARADALEAYYEFAKTPPVISFHGDVTRIEPPQ